MALFCSSPTTLSSILRREFHGCFVFSATGDTGTHEVMAPIIVVAPGNRSVVAGSSETTLECIANARYRMWSGQGELRWGIHHLKTQTLTYFQIWDFEP